MIVLDDPGVSGRHFIIHRITTVLVLPGPFYNWSFVTYLVEVSADRAQSPAASGLKNRHLQFMAIGGVIGAGFFLGSGLAISKAGPALLIAYVVAGAVVFLMMRALGELSLAYPSAGSFSTYATQFIGPITGFVTGWSFWLTALMWASLSQRA
jgi:L-asparagine transporter-like permease